MQFNFDVKGLLNHFASEQSSGGIYTLSGEVIRKKGGESNKYLAQVIDTFGHDSALVSFKHQKSQPNFLNLF